MNYIIELKRNIEEVKKFSVEIDKKLFKIIRIGGGNNNAITVQWFGLTPGVNGGAWNTCMWDGKRLNNLGRDVIKKVVEELHEKQGQTVLV